MRYRDFDATLPFIGPLSLGLPCFMAVEGEGEGEQPGGGGGGSSGEGDLQRVNTTGDGAAEAEAMARAARHGEEVPKAEGLPEGFDSLEAFVEAVNKGDYPPKPAEGGEEAKPDAAKEQTLPTDDPRFAPFNEEFTSTGTLSEESVGKAAAAFLGEDNPANRAMVQAYVRGLQGAAGESAAETTVAALPFYEAAGGADEFAEFQKWTQGAGNITEAEERAYMSLIAAGKQAEALAVAKPLMDRWKAAGGGKPARDATDERQGEGGGKLPTTGSEGDTFASWAQVEAAMNDPRYQSDPAYRQSVEVKLGRSNLGR